MLSAKIHKAIIFSEEAHREQKRKGGNIPYIVHPLSVAFILGRLGVKDDDVIISAILHDVVEDCGVSLLEIKEMFGERVVLLVDQVTEKGVSWIERKDSVVSKLDKMEKDALLIKSADMLHNISDLLLDIERMGDKAFDKFSVPKEEKINHCKRVINKMKIVWPENPLISDLEERMELLK